MRLTDIREATASISSQIQNAYVNFSQMTISVVAVESDVVRHGRPLTGYGFCSNGRYAQGGILRERLIPRLRTADKAAGDGGGLGIADTNWTGHGSHRLGGYVASYPIKVVGVAYAPAAAYFRLGGDRQEPFAVFYQSGDP